MGPAEDTWYLSWFNEDYLKLYPHRNLSAARREIEFLEKFLGIRKGWRILDVGCGAGRHSVELSSRGYQVVGLDRSGVLLEKARELGRRKGVVLDLVLGDLRALPFQHETFQLALWLFNGFGYFNDNENECSLLEVSRVMTRGACLVMEYFNKDFLTANIVGEEELIGDGWKASIARTLTRSPVRVEKRIEIQEAGGVKRYTESVRLYTVEELIRIAERSGFSVQSTLSGFAPRAFKKESQSLLLVLRK